MHKTDFPLLQQSISYLDNAATAQKPSVVLQSMDEFYRTTNANVHRGLYRISEQATAQYEQVRDDVKQFIHAAEREEIIFTSGTTAALNTVAYSLSELLLQPGDVIWLSDSEHHSNLVPWQMIAQQYDAKLVFFNPEELPTQLPERTKIVSLAHITNSSGYIMPVEAVIQLAHAQNVPVMIDAAQSVPHQAIDVQALDCDFLAFSAHKLCGPTGVGVLYGKRKWLEQMQPVFGGGDMIKHVTLQKTIWNDLPYKFEAGTPNIAGVIGLGAAIKYLNQLGMAAVQLETQAVYGYLMEQLQQLEFVKCYGSTDLSKRSSIASFTIQGAHAHDVASILDQHNVAIRAGHHCAQPVMERWCVPATARASVYFYNDHADVDRLITGLKDVYAKFK